MPMGTSHSMKLTMRSHAADLVLFEFVDRQFSNNRSDGVCGAG